MTTKFKPYAVKTFAEHQQHQEKAVVNFMAGISYTLNPLDNLRIIACSSFFGEPSYYRDSHDTESYIKNIIIKTYGSDYLLSDIIKGAKNTTEVFTKAIDAALAYDFKATLDFAAKLRNEFFMRLNPSVIMVRAALHPQRKANNANSGLIPGYLRKVNVQEIIKRPDDIINQFQYYMFLCGAKNKLPSVLKRAWGDALLKFSPYQLLKYRTSMLFDVVRISHPSLPQKNQGPLSELMKTGTIQVKDSEIKWESLKAQGKNWHEILSTIDMPHMALLRNLRNIFSELDEKEREFASAVLNNLKSGVLTGKQFPFRYYTAYQIIENNSEVKFGRMILDALEECMDVSVANFPKLSGKTMCLSDNSGSAREGLTSEYGSTMVCDIANLSSLITGLNSDEGAVGIFGDRLTTYQISKREGLLSQQKKLDKIGGDIGGATENGIWLFFDGAIKEKKFYDNIFIYSDQQAGHGGLYGMNKDDYKPYAYKHPNSEYIDVLKLAQAYRKTVNPKVNLFSVQVAGYDNSVLPENYYRTAILSGWTGNETLYASEFINFWNEKESNKNQ